MNHLIAYPLTWDDIELRANTAIGIYKIKNNSKLKNIIYE